MVGNSIDCKRWNFFNVYFIYISNLLDITRSYASHVAAVLMILRFIYFACLSSPYAQIVICLVLMRMMNRLQNE